MQKSLHYILSLQEMEATMKGYKCVSVQVMSKHGQVGLAFYALEFIIDVT